jgi:hypothetical protein
MSFTASAHAAQYLSRDPNIAQPFSRGKFGSGCGHHVKLGGAEGLPPVMPDPVLKRIGGTAT